MEAFYGIFYINQNFEDTIQPWVALIDRQESQFAQAKCEGAGRAGDGATGGDHHQHASAHGTGQENQANPNGTSTGQEPQEHRDDYPWEQGHQVHTGQEAPGSPSSVTGSKCRAGTPDKEDENRSNDELEQAAKCAKDNKQDEALFSWTAEALIKRTTLSAWHQAVLK
ncbi:hypothetical protein GYMLUDRAFT_239387 [Collybiopsis luxurians FD-317 M1]|nr:hypothetical protein GYMLUDRAFT_239387 [Collybiopsis luxurians FD-317 M1]